MTAVVARQPRSFLGRLAFSARQSQLGPALSRAARVSAAAAREHATTFVAWAAIDVGAFTAARAAGWIVAGVAVLALDFHVRD